MQIYRRKISFHSAEVKLQRLLETSLKTGLIALYAAPLSWIATAFWYFVLVKNDIHLNEKMEVIATASWIPLFGIFYGFLASTLIAKVFDQYSDMRIAIKRYDFDKFAELRDENLSPLMHGLMSVLAAMTLAGFMAIKYPTELQGFVVVGSVSYVLSFIFYVVREVDEPLGGVWFIRHVHDGWLEVDVKLWREKRHKEDQEKFQQDCHVFFPEEATA
jgi:hypothetical protein